MNPDHEYGYTESHLREILGDQWEEFSQWMRGQTVALDNETNKPVYYECDVKKFLSDDRRVFD
jgi:hypothetical protein